MTRRKESCTAYLLFADIKGFSDLSGENLRRSFHERFFPRLAELVTGHSPLAWHLWGDAVYALFAEPMTAAAAALDLRDFFRDYPWKDAGLPRLTIRISLQLEKIIKGEEGAAFLGSRLNLPARVEPVLRPGEVWTADPFASRFLAKQPGDMTTDNLGPRPLAMKWGGQEIHRLRRLDDPPLADDDIYEKIEMKRVDPVAILLALYERGDDQQQLNAVQMLGRQEDPRASEKLCSIARNPALSLVLRHEAISSLGNLKNAGAFPVLAAMLRPEENEDPRLQLACLKAVGEMADPRTGEVILRILQDRHAFQEVVVRRSMEMLARVPSQSALDYLAWLLNTRALPFRLLKTALQVLTIAGHHGGASSAIDLLDREHPEEIRQAALIYLVHDEPQQIKTELKSLAANPVEPLPLRIVALAGLTRIDTHETRIVVAEIAEAAGSLSSYAAQFLVEGNERVASYMDDFRDEFMEESRKGL